MGLIDLNFIVEFATGHQDIKLELDSNLTRQYTSEEFTQIGVGLTNVFREMNEHRGPNILARTSQDKQNEILEVLAEGQELNQQTIALLTRSYSGEHVHRIKVSGSYYAGEYLRKVNATISIENCNEGIYTVRNKILIPKQS